ncbi:MAG: class I SAM-dependent methyltransferase [Candidatus Binatus sp.]|uniref:class I SAM-dependent methyltransferase n=1 Tax=Candidatus Binatus sp. TaxID=2811406 RepID=UPI002722D1F5|nr:class I SAM-dependent methyltransferase [Candidatus Binatus sp.]MDO8435054.1 class I SAM-dependent methyltransferase [Candidatus Binatus sp.]
MSSTQVVRDYFDREAKRFDAIYEQRKPIVQQVVDRLFRQVVVERYRLICNLAPCGHRWTALDVGCGSGRYTITLAQAGAARVVGVDVSTEMLDLAHAEAVRARVTGNCEFVASSFVDYAAPQKFDSVIAAGYFDYLKDPLVDLKKMIADCSGRLFCSFPKRWEYRAPTRKLRFAIANGYVRFYSRREVVGLFTDAGLATERLSLIDLGRDWIACARAPQS